MFIMVDVLRKPDGNKPGMMPAVIARRKFFPEHDSVIGFVFFAHGPSFQNGVGLGSLIPAPPRQPTAHELGNFGPFSRPLPVPLAPPYGPNSPDRFHCNIAKT